jgi:transcription antitermination factor NusG
MHLCLSFQQAVKRPLATCDSEGEAVGSDTLYPAVCSNNNFDGGQWFALSTMSRHERLAAHEIQSRGVETFLPTFTEIHRWSDRKKKLEVPLFPGYLFIRAEMSPEVRRKVLFARGIVSFVGMGGQPVPIPQQEISTLQQLLQTGTSFSSHAFLKIGQRIRIHGGSLDGIEGILSKVEGGDRLVVSVESIQRSIAIHLDGYKVEALRSN